MIFRTHNRLILIFSLLLSNALHTKTIVFDENPYAAQAPQELVSKAEQVAQAMDFTDSYEIAIPKKPGIEVNPWNKFIYSITNPQTQNFFILVNPAWFAAVPHEEQTFLLGRCFMQLKHGVTPFSTKIAWYLFALISLLTAVFIFLGFGYTPLADQPAWLKVVMALAFVMVCEFAFMNTLYAKLEKYLQEKHSHHIHELVVEKTNDRAAAIRALQYFDTSIKHEYKNGEIAFAPFINVLDAYAEKLKKSA